MTPPISIDFLETDLDALATAEGTVAVIVTEDGKLDPAGRRVNRLTRGAVARAIEGAAWNKAKAGDVVTVGITEHAATQLGDLVFVELPEIGTRVAKGDEIVTIESVKAASDIAAPLDGEIVAVNDALADAPGLVNEDPTGAAWFFKIRVADPGALDAYMTEDDYRDHVGQ